MLTTTKTKRRRQSGRRANIQRHKFAMCAKKCRGSKNYKACVSACLKG